LSSQPASPNLRHGARSETTVKARETQVKRAFLRARGLTESDLDARVIELLDEWAEARAIVELLHEYIRARGGPLGDDGEPVGASKQYWLARNSAARHKRVLEEALEALEPDPEQQMRELLSSKWDDETEAEIEEDEEPDDPEPEPEPGSFLKPPPWTAQPRAEATEGADQPPAPPEAPRRVRHEPPKPVSPYAWLSQKSRRGVGCLPDQF